MKEAIDDEHPFGSSAVRRAPPTCCSAMAHESVQFEATSRTERALDCWKSERHDRKIPVEEVFCLVKGLWYVSNQATSLAPLTNSWDLGDIVYLNVLGSPVVVLNKFEHAHELLDKQGSTYSDRPRMVYIIEV